MRAHLGKFKYLGGLHHLLGNVILVFGALPFAVEALGSLVIRVAQFVNQTFDLTGGHLSVGKEAAHFVGYYRKTAPMLPRTGSFNRI